MVYNNIIIYILYKIRNIKSNIGITRIIKILYLADLISLSRLKEKITDIKYQYYFFGPYSDDIIKSLNDLVEIKSIIDHKIYTNSGISHDYRLSNEFEKKSNECDFKIDKRKKLIIDEVVKNYGDMKLDNLLEIVYSTKPMKEHAPGDVLL